MCLSTISTQNCVKYRKGVKMNINDRIKNERIARGISQGALSKELNIHQQNISRWEKGDNIPNIYDCAKIADYFGVTIDYLVGREDDFGVVKIENAPQIAKDEKEILAVYKLLSQEDKQKVLSIIKALVKD